jgi:uncharacterized membrane protein
MLQLWLMGVCSFGLYFYWWSYKNWVQIRDHKKIAIGPRKRVIGMIVPLLGYYVTWLQFHDINEAVRQAETKVYASEGMLMLGMIIANSAAYIALNSASKTPALFLVGLMFLCLEVGVMYSAQLTLNDFWKKEQEGLPLKKGWSLGQGLVIVVGGIYLLIMVAAGLMGLAGVPT